MSEIGEIRTRLSDKVYDLLSDRILQGVWPEGTRIPSEAELSGSFSVSRPVVREALDRLRSEGRIGSRRGSGSVVLAGARPTKQIYKPIENVADLIHGFEFRITIECDSAALAALRVKPEALAAIYRAHDAFSAQASDEEFSRFDLAFHQAVGKASGNPLIEITLELLRPQIEFGMKIAGEFDGQEWDSRGEAIRREHGLIVEAIAARNPDEAYRAMRDHLLLSRTRILGFEIEESWRSVRWADKEKATTTPARD